MFSNAMIKRVENRMPLRFAILLSLVVFVLTLSCGGEKIESGRMNVVVSILPLADFAKQLGQDKIEVTVMIPPGASPHTYEPKPVQLIAVSKARVFVKAGSGVEFELAWMDKLYQINPKMMVLNSSEGLELEERDPHVWLSPLNAKKMVENICEGLVEIDPGNKEYYTSNKEDYLKQLDDLNEFIKVQLDDLRNKMFFVYHPAWGYLAKDYNLEQISVEREGKEPTAEEIRKVVEKVKELGDRTIFVSPQFATKGAEVVAAEIGGSVEFLDPLPQSYISDMRALVQLLAKTMR
jgi:zinc transport system substrate-binding protein